MRSMAADLFNLAVPGNIYTRIMNPTSDVLEQRVAALEGGVTALALSSGQAAIHYSIINIAEMGNNIVSVPLLYGGTYTLFAHMLPKLGIEVRFAKDDHPESLESLIDHKTAAVFCESLGNPAGNIPDMEAICAMAHRHGVPVIVDNTVPTPVLMKPFESGADIVVHSLTKYMGGHGTSIGGIIVDSGKFPWVDHADLAFRCSIAPNRPIMALCTHKNSAPPLISAVCVLSHCATPVRPYHR